MATEWIVEARSGGTCVVRVVHSLFASADDWDDQIESIESGWPTFFRILRTYLTNDGRFFKGLAWLHPRTRVPVLAILLQAGCSILIALTGKYNEILNYVISVDTIFTLLILSSIFIFRRRDASTARTQLFRVPGHPVTTILLMLVYAGVLISLFYRFPANGLMGAAIALTGVPAYFFWSRRKAHNSDITAISQADISLAN